MENPHRKPILAAVDFSAESKAALEFAARLCASEERPLVVLHVVHDKGSNGGSYRRPADFGSLLPLHEIAERSMHDFFSRVCKEHAGPNAITSARKIVVDGLPVTRILEFARHVDAGHIVLGYSERGRLARMFDGSVSKSLATKSPVPVSVIHAQAQAAQ